MCHVQSFNNVAVFQSIFINWYWSVLELQDVLAGLRLPYSGQCLSYTQVHNCTTSISFSLSYICLDQASRQWINWRLPLKKQRLVHRDLSSGTKYYHRCVGLAHRYKMKFSEWWMQVSTISLLPPFIFVWRLRNCTRRLMNVKCGSHCLGRSQSWRTQ